MGVYGGPNKVKEGIVFSLDGANPASYAGDSVTTYGTPYGYAMGGPTTPGGSSNTTIVQRIDYGNDTATAVTKGPLSLDRKNHSASGNTYYGYNAGGHINPGFTATSSTDRIDYASDTSTATPKGTLTFSASVRGSTSNTSYGWFGGGTPSPYKSNIDRLDFSNDTATASPRGPLSSAKSSMGTAGNASYGYFAGGTEGPSGLSTVNRIDYSSDTGTTPTKGPLSSARESLVAFGNSSYGYFGGDYPGSITTIDRIDYSNDTATASVKGPLDEGKRNSGGVASASGYGYAMGGQPSSSPSTSSISRVEFANDTATASPKGNLYINTTGFGAVSSRDNGLPTESISTRSTTQINGTPYGYFGGGKEPSDVSTVDRIDYSNDTTTASTKGPLSSARYTGGSTGNTSYGYWGGGGPSHGISTVDRVDYANDSATASTKGPLNRSTYLIAATGNASYGYFAGDVPGSSVSRIDYSNDTATAAAKGPLSYSTFYLGATGNASYGWFGAGTNSALSTVCRIDYSNDTPTASPKGDLSAPNNMVAATGNASYGYFGAGEPADYTSKVDRIDYSNDTATALVKGPLSAVKSRHGATGDTSYGYFAGGMPGTNSTVDRLDFSNDTTAALKGPLTANRRNVTGASPQANSLGSDTVYLWNDISGRGNNANITDSRFRATDGGYFTFDGTGDFLTVPSTNAFAFGTGDFSVEYWVRTPASGTNFGYFGGGYNPSRVQSGINRIDYSNDTATASQVSHFAGASPSGRNQLKRLFGVASSTHAYWGGGTHSLGSESTSIFRLDLSNDTTNTSAIGNLSAAGSDFSAVGNASYGYINGDSKTRVDRIDYSNDDTTTAVKGDLNQTRVLPGATGNSSYGWFGGGGYSRSSVDRIDYSNDTATASPRGDLNRNNVPDVAATGNANFGYWGGGGPGSTTYVDRVDYSNDTASATPKGPLSVARDKHGATGNSNFGYIGGGQPGPLSSVERIDFSNDTATAAPKGSLNITPGINGKDYLAGASSKANGFSLVNAANIINPDSETGSGYWAHQYDTTFDWNSEYGDGSSLGTNYGYITGNSAPAYTTTNNRIDFASDTGTTATKGPLSAAKGYHRGVSSLSYGYLGGGYHPSVHPGYSTVDRLDYSSDTDTAVEKGPLTQNMTNGGGAGNTSYGYIGGGSLGGTPYSTINRIDYADDTPTALAKGPLNTARTGLNATGNLSYGYWGGGHTGWPNFVSTIDRIDYSNDTPTASPKGALSQKREGVAATSNASYGYWGGGYDSPPSVYTSLVDRVDFSNDTATAVAKGPLTVGRRRIGGATGTTSYGYWGGGETTPGGKVSTVDRLDYSSDSTTTSPKGPLSAIAMQQGTVSSRANGFPTTSATTELYNCALSPVNDGDWHNVVITRVGGTQQAYYDGVGITTTGGTYTDGTDYSGVDGWFIGKGGGTAFKGDLANITIRKGKGLSSDEVQQNFNSLKSRFGV